MKFADEKLLKRLKDVTMEQGRLMREPEPEPAPAAAATTVCAGSRASGLQSS